MFNDFCHLIDLTHNVSSANIFYHEKMLFNFYKCVTFIFKAKGCFFLFGSDLNKLLIKTIASNLLSVVTYSKNIVCI